MKRDIYQALKDWKNSPLRKPLLLRGARQVGKTYILREFGRNEFKTTAYLNFEEDRSLESLFTTRFDKKNFLAFISAYCNLDANAKNMLIILDEIQASPRALNALKYFNEYAPEYCIACAGSMLGIKLAQESSFPVGKVNFLDLYPMSFLEYLDALDKSRYRQLLTVDPLPLEPFPEALHLEMHELFKQYCLVGGMPEAVSTYSRTNDYNKVRKAQHEILESYLLDFAKHAPKTEIMKLTAIWEAIPRNLARANKKFIFSSIGPSARSKKYEYSLQWLLDAGLLLKCPLVSRPSVPLEFYKSDSSYKLFLFDVGMLGARLGLSPEKILLEKEVGQYFKGALSENYVAQQLWAKYPKRLFYWTSEGKAEVDFILAERDIVFPLEVKAGHSLHSKSLQVFDNKYQPPVLSRISLNNLKQDGRHLNFPFYAVSRFPSLIQTEHTDVS